MISSLISPIALVVYSNLNETLRVPTSCPTSSHSQSTTTTIHHHNSLFSPTANIQHLISLEFILTHAIRQHPNARLRRLPSSPQAQHFAARHASHPGPSICLTSECTRPARQLLICSIRACRSFSSAWPTWRFPSVCFESIRPLRICPSLRCPTKSLRIQPLWHSNRLVITL